MNILYLAHRIPYPPNKGDKLRSFHQLHWLSKRHRVWCACFVDRAEDRRYVNELRRLCVDVAAIRLRRTPATVRAWSGLLLGGTLTESYYAQRGMRQALSRWSEHVSFDAVVAFSSSMARYALCVGAPRRVLDLCDRDSQKWLDYAEFSHVPKALMYQTEGRRLAVLEEKFVGQFDATILITEAEASGLRTVARPGKLHVAGNGVRCRAGFQPEFSPPVSRRHTTDRPLTVGFVGAMDYHPNVDGVCWFVERCWPAIRATFPAACFRIVGRSPTRQVRRLGRIPGVVIVGGVTDVGPQIEQFDLSVAPLRIARGLQNKVLEAFSSAKPVVLTSAVAAGLEGRRGQDYIVADDPEDFGHEVCRLLADPSRRQQLGRAAAAYTAANHRWDDELREFEMIVTGTGATRSMPAALALAGQPTENPPPIVPPENPAPVGTVELLPN